MYLIAGIAALAMISGLAYKTYQAGDSSVRLEWAEANQKARTEEAKKGNDAAKGLEADREKTRTVYRTITREVDKVVDRPVYRNVCLDAAGLRLARCAILGQSPDTCKPDGALPAPIRPSGWDGGIRITMDHRISRELPELR